MAALIVKDERKFRDGATEPDDDRPEWERRLTSGALDDDESGET